MILASPLSQSEIYGQIARVGLARMKHWGMAVYSLRYGRVTPQTLDRSTVRFRIPILVN